jgi:hypothetical protein
MKSAAAVEHPQCSRVIIDYTGRDYVGGVDLPPYDKILDELSVALFRKYPDLVAGA